MTTNAGDKVKFWRNKRPVTHRDAQEAVVLAVGPKEIKPPEGEKGLAVSLAAGEFWLRVKNAANGREFFVVSKPSEGPEPGCFTNEKPAAAVAPAPAPEPVRTPRAARVTTEA